jgi:hypothetical protein
MTKNTITIITVAVAISIAVAVTISIVTAILNGSGTTIEGGLKVWAIVTVAFASAAAAAVLPGFMFSRRTVTEVAAICGAFSMALQTHEWALHGGLSELCLLGSLCEPCSWAVTLFIIASSVVVGFLGLKELGVVVTAPKAAMEKRIPPVVVGRDFDCTLS